MYMYTYGQDKQESSHADWVGGFEKIVRQQGSKTREWLQETDITWEKFEVLRQALNTHARPWSVVHEFGGSLPSQILPHLIFPHLCEYRQALDDPTIGSAGVAAALAKIPESYAHSVSNIMGQFMREGSKLNPRKCLLQHVVNAILGADARAGKQIAESVGGGKSPSVQQQLKDKPHGGESPSALPKVDYKGIVECEFCGAEVRRDGIYRHYRSQNCADRRPVRQKLRPAKAVPKKTGSKRSVACKLCKANVRVDCLRRHQLSQKCVDNRPRRQLRPAKAVPKKTGVKRSVDCILCKANVRLDVLRRHQRSQKCHEQRVKQNKQPKNIGIGHTRNTTYIYIYMHTYIYIYTLFVFGGGGGGGLICSRCAAQVFG